MPSKGTVKVAVAAESVLFLTEPAIEEAAFGFGTALSEGTVREASEGLSPTAPDNISCGIGGGCGLIDDRHDESVPGMSGLPKLKIAGSANDCDADFEDDARALLCGNDTWAELYG